jgi:hypothetical protein
MRVVDSGAPAAARPDGPALEAWQVAAVGPTWRPAPGEKAVTTVDGVLEVLTDALVFRAHDALDTATSAPLVAVIPAATIRTVGPLSPGSAGSGGWMPGWQRRFRSPGFAVGTDMGAWVFDCPHGQRRAGALRDRFGLA